MRSYFRNTKITYYYQDSSIPENLSVTCDYRTGKQTDGETNEGQSDPYVLLCFACDMKITLFVLIFAR